MSLAERCDYAIHVFNRCTARYLNQPLIQFQNGRTVMGQTATSCEEARICAVVTRNVDSTMESMKRCFNGILSSVLYGGGELLR